MLRTVARHGAHLTQRRLDVLAFDCRLDGGYRQVERGYLVGVEPYAHGQRRGVNVDFADAVHSDQVFLDVVLNVVAQEQRIMSAVGRTGGQKAQLVGRAAADGNALLLNFRRQFAQCLRYAVLHLDLRHIGVGADLESDRQTVTAGCVRRRIHVKHVFHAVDRFFQRNTHRVGDNLGAGAGIGGRNPDGRRGNFRIKSDRQRKDGDCAGKRQHNRNDHRKTRSFNENP